MNTDFKPVYKYEIFIGLKDENSYDEIVCSEDFMTFWMMFFQERKVSYSLKKTHGGYSHSGTYSASTSLVVTFIDVEFDMIVEAANAIKSLIATDAILVTREMVDMGFI